MKDSAVRLREISIARDTLKLAPGLATGVPIRPDVATAEPTVLGAIVIRTEVLRGVDSASASPGEDHHWRGRAGGLGTRIDSLLTRFAEWFVDISRERFGLFGTFASGLIRLEGPGTCSPGRVGPPDMHHEADQHESNE
jgi:hypothetical protein